MSEIKYTTKTKKSASADYPLTLLYDGACAICQLEMDHLAQRNAAGQLAFVDIAAPGFDASAWAGSGATLADMQAAIHAVRPDGSLLSGVRVIQLAYAAVGLRQVAAPLAWPVLQPLLRLAYGLFARNRYAVSRLLAPLVSRVAAARALRRMQACQRNPGGQHCALPVRAGSPHAIHVKELAS